MMQQKRRGFEERRGLGARVEAQRDGGGRAGRGDEHCAAETNLHESMDMPAHDALHLGVAAQNGVETRRATAIVLIDACNSALDRRLVHHQDGRAPGFPGERFVEPATGLVVDLAMVGARDRHIETEDAHGTEVAGVEMQGPVRTNAAAIANAGAKALAGVVIARDRKPWPTERRKRVARMRIFRIRTFVHEISAEQYEVRRGIEGVQMANGGSEHGVGINEPLIEDAGRPEMRVRQLGDEHDVSNPCSIRREHSTSPRRRALGFQPA
jgi:hypothetical protein